MTFLEVTVTFLGVHPDISGNVFGYFWDTLGDIPHKILILVVSCFIISTALEYSTWHQLYILT